jgi:decaprenylphospho-beta-D-erythro-pentofuranosid-2-ulose 2-reductase
MASLDASALRILVVGATSAIATEVARRYARRGACLVLLARREAALQALADDLRVRGARAVQTIRWDATELERCEAVVEQSWACFQGFDAALIAHGVLPDQGVAERAIADALVALDINARSVIGLLTVLAPRFEAQGDGVIGVVSSPAGARGRASNYVYGAAKAAVTVFAGGLEHRLFRKGVRVLTILPGFVDTPMTSAFRKGRLWASPARVAIDIERGLDRGRGKLYTPGFWRWIMLIVIHLPRPLFLRSRL